VHQNTPGRDLEGVNAIVQVGFQHWKEGRLDRAKEVFERLAAASPDDAYFQTMLGSIAQRSFDLVTAEQRYTRAIALNPESPVPYANRGEVRMEKGNLLGAALDLTRAMAADLDAQMPTTRRAQVLAVTLQSRLPKIRVQ
jgi:Flp pilus assembly protein TadD